jgi:hypothetical protein
MNGSLYGSVQVETSVWRRRLAAPLPRFPEHDHAVGIRMGKRMQQDGVDEAEHQGSGADS